MENLSTLQALATKLNDDAVAALQPNPGYVAFLEEGSDIGGIDVGFLVKGSRIGVMSVVQEGKTATFIDPVNGQPSCSTTGRRSSSRATRDPAGRRRVRR